jgi:putative redox protein
MAETMSAQAKLATGMRFEVEAGSGHHVTLDAAEHGGGHDEGFRPMEMLLVGLAGCTGMDVISILRKEREPVAGYEVHVTGVRAEAHPMVFVEITVEHIVTGDHIQAERYSAFRGAVLRCRCDAWEGSSSHTYLPYC